jgi:hypothetical protein
MLRITFLKACGRRTSCTANVICNILLEDNMNEDLNSYRIYTQKSETDKAFHTLEGILKGINIDGKILENEITELKQWCGTHYRFIDKAPFNEAIPLIMEITEDNKITSSEYEDLKWFCETITTKNKYYDVVTSDMQRLQGILHGILADNKITQEEIIGLKDWISDHSDLMGVYPYDEIESIIYSVLDDGVVSEDEQNLLKVYFSQFIDFSQSTIDKNEIDQLIKDIQLPVICTMNPDVTFKSKLFCFTGISSKGKRSDIVSKIESLNGIYNDNVLQGTNYLIIGDKNNPCWAFSCYGRKVEKALENRKGGLSIQIVKEIDFWDATYA